MYDDLFRRIAEALERMAPPVSAVTNLSTANAFVWHAKKTLLSEVKHVSCVGLEMLQGIDQQKLQLLENTVRFVKKLPANNAMLWGARGTGKSSLVKAVHGEINRLTPGALVIVEIQREEIGSLSVLLNILREVPRQVLILCDDLSFERGDGDYKALKSVLDGGIEGRPTNVLFYATSNRRHLMPRDMIENESSTSINPGEAVEEAVSLSDRFGLWLGFHNSNQEQFFSIIEGYAEAYKLPISRDELRTLAVEWSITRGSRSGRVAWQFIQDVAGRLEVRLT